MMYWMKREVNPSCNKEVTVGMYGVYFMSLSTITRIVSCSRDQGKPVIRLREATSHRS